MKIAIPTNGDRGLDEEIGFHFGRVSTYTIVDTDTNEVTVIDNTSEHQGGTGLPPDIIVRAGASVMLISAAGMMAIQMLNKYGIKVYTGAQGTVRQALEDLEKGVLKSADIDDACEGHHQYE